MEPECTVESNWYTEYSIRFMANSGALLHTPRSKKRARVTWTGNDDVNTLLEIDALDLANKEQDRNGE